MGRAHQQAGVAGRQRGENHDGTKTRAVQTVLERNQALRGRPAGRRRGSGRDHESNRVEEAGLRAKVSGTLHTGVIRISEFIQPEGEFEQKLYAPGVGKITEYPPDGRAELVRCR